MYAHSAPASGTAALQQPLPAGVHIGGTVLPQLAQEPPAPPAPRPPATIACLQGNHKSPIEYIQSTQPIKVHGLTVASYGCEPAGVSWAQLLQLSSWDWKGGGAAGM